jgi:hypothetical protein
VDPAQQNWDSVFCTHSCARMRPARGKGGSGRSAEQGEAQKQSTLYIISVEKGLEHHLVVAPANPTSWAIGFKIALKPTFISATPFQYQGQTSKKQKAKNEKRKQTHATAASGSAESTQRHLRACSKVHSLAYVSLSQSKGASGGGRLAPPLSLRSRLSDLVGSLHRQPSTTCWPLLASLESAGSARLLAR